MKAKVFNHSRQLVEQGAKVTCPRCKGSGRKLTDVDSCYLCKGHGELYMTPSGWTRAKYARLEDSQLW